MQQLRQGDAERKSGERVSRPRRTRPAASGGRTSRDAVAGRSAVLLAVRGERPLKQFGAHRAGWHSVPLVRAGRVFPARCQERRASGAHGLASSSRETRPSMAHVGGPITQATEAPPRPHPRLRPVPSPLPLPPLLPPAPSSPQGFPRHQFVGEKGGRSRGVRSGFPALGRAGGAGGATALHCCAGGQYTTIGGSHGAMKTKAV